MSFKETLSAARADAFVIDYKQEIGAAVDEIFGRLELSSSDWGAIEVDDRDIHHGQRRAPGTRHIVIEEGGAWAAFWIDIDNGYRIVVDVIARPLRSSVSIDIAGVLMKPELRPEVWDTLRKTLKEKAATKAVKVN